MNNVDIDYKVAYIKRLLYEMNNGHQNKVVIASKDFEITGIRKGNKIVIEIAPFVAGT